VTSDRHSTVWVGEQTLFDFNFTALGFDPEDAWDLAITDGYVLEPGAFLETGIAVDL
jgi:hypothetical protein